MASKKERVRGRGVGVFCESFWWRGAIESITFCDK